MSSNKGPLLPLHPPKLPANQHSKMMLPFLTEVCFTHVFTPFFLNTFAYKTSMCITRWKKVF